MDVKLRRGETCSLLRAVAVFFTEGFVKTSAFRPATSTNFLTALLPLHLRKASHKPLSSTGPGSRWSLHLFHPWRLIYGSAKVGHQISHSPFNFIIHSFNRKTSLSDGTNYNGFIQLLAQSQVSKNPTELFSLNWGLYCTNSRFHVKKAMLCGPVQ